MDGLGGQVAFLGDVGIVQGGSVGGGRAGLAGEVEADGELGDGRHGEIHGIAEEDDAGSDGAAGLAVEGQGAIGIGGDGRILGADGEVGGSDDHDGRAAECVREADAQAAAAEAGADDHADGLILEAARVDRLAEWRRGRRAAAGWRADCAGRARTRVCAVAQVATQRS